MGSDKSNPNDLDIWGSPIKGVVECFHCGVTYDIETSSAPIDYAATYCTRACYEADMRQMHVEEIIDRKLDERTASAASYDHDAPNRVGNLDTKYIGDFKLKVQRKKEAEDS